LFLYWFTQPLGLCPILCNHSQGFPLIQLTFKIKSLTRHLLEPYKKFFYPFAEPTDKMHTHNANATHQCRSECKKHNITIQLQVFPQLQCLNTPIKHYPIKKLIKNTIQLENSQMQQLTTTKGTKEEHLSSQECCYYTNQSKPSFVFLQV